jgi:hypothetical protein
VFVLRTVFFLIALAAGTGLSAGPLLRWYDIEV